MSITYKINTITNTSQYFKYITAGAMLSRFTVSQGCFASSVDSKAANSDTLFSPANNSPYSSHVGYPGIFLLLHRVY